MSSNSVNSSLKLNTTYKTPTDYLTARERKTIFEADTLAKRANTLGKSESDFFNLSLQQILKNWSNNMQAILIDLTDTLHVNDDIKKTQNIYEFLVVFFGKIWTIFTKDFRIIYFGMTLIFISILIYFVYISS